MKSEGVPVSADLPERMRLFEVLVREWNDFASLVSRNALDDLDAHVADSLSLARWVHRLTAPSASGFLLDLGSGAGFPAIPLAACLPACRITLVERSAKKIGFLRKVVAALGLDSVTVMQGTFPVVQPQDLPACVTARAIEQPERVTADMLALVKRGSVFLCQTDRLAPFPADTFHVEHIDDIWAHKSLRRGQLRVISA